LHILESVNTHNDLVFTPNYNKSAIEMGNSTTPINRSKINSLDHMIKVSDYIAGFLADHSIRKIFSISGAGNVHLLDSINRNPELDYVCPHHEQSCVMAAIAYSRLSPHLGTALTTGGPGAINAFSGVLDAWADSIPVLIISGQEKSCYTDPKNPLRMWGVQGFNVVHAVSGFTKYAVTIRDSQTLRYHLERALFECMNGRPGPVWLDIPMDIQASEIDPKSLLGYTADISYKKTQPLGEIDETIQSFQKAKRPVILLGHGLRLSGGMPLISKLLERFPAAVLTSWAGADMLPNDFCRYYGHAGVYGQRCANFVLQNCDFLLTIGSRLAIPQVGYEMKEFARAAKKIMVDIDPTELQKHSEIFDLTIQADASVFTSALLNSSENTKFPVMEEWISLCSHWREKYPLTDPVLHASQGGFVNSYQFTDHLSDHLNTNDVIITDMGTALTCTHQAIKIKKGQRLITSTGLGEMGFGLPGAVGACFARPDERVILIAGDGSFMMNLQELQTVVHHKLPIKIFLYCNNAYLTIKHTQSALFSGRLSGTDPGTGVSCPDFKKIAEAFGIRSLSLEDPQMIDKAIKETMRGVDPVICVIKMHPMQPLVPKVTFSMLPNGTMVSPPLEDLFPYLPRKTMREEMIIGMHPKSELI